MSAWIDHPLEGLPLMAPTPAAWCETALAHLDEVLIDHAWCEHKAASSALGLIGRFPDAPELVRPMIALAQEEILHFRQVVDLLEKRGLSLGAPRRDRYVRDLKRRFTSEGRGIGGLGDLLLVNAFVEARSCERFRLLARALEESDREERVLASFYRRLADAEGRHWETFRGLSGQFIEESRVERRVRELAEIEGKIVAGLPIEPRMH